MRQEPLKFYEENYRLKDAALSFVPPPVLSQSFSKTILSLFLPLECLDCCLYFCIFLYILFLLHIIKFPPAFTPQFHTQFLNICDVDFQLFLRSFFSLSRGWKKGFSEWKMSFFSTFERCLDGCWNGLLNFSGHFFLNSCDKMKRR